ncbi:RtcB family protein, partial [Escherichia coli]
MFWHVGCNYQDSKQRKEKNKMNYELLTTENAPVKMWTK